MELDGSDNAGEQPPSPEDSPAISQFIENMGLHYQEYDFPRIGGRILGLLLVTPRPISSEEMAEALQVSRSSVSTNLRTLLMTDMVEKVSLPGDRVDYYVLSDAPWQTALEMRLAAILDLKTIAEEALEDLSEKHPAQLRLKEMIDWVQMVEDLVQNLRQEWQSRQEVPVNSG
jgi:DNA-binding transcriptional regulator GbsR (MarR family)